MNVTTHTGFPVAGATSPAPAANAPSDELKKAAKAFEAVFLRQMIGSMRQASLGEDLFGSSATQQYQEMADSRTADALADKGALGIANLLLAQFKDHRAPDGPAIGGTAIGTKAHES